MMFFTSDFHLFHDAIISHSDRPFKDTNLMWRAIKRNWNKTVGKDDTTWILGDLTMKGRDYKDSLAKMINQLNGRKNLIYGNHDRMLPRDYVDIGFTTIHYPVFQLTNLWWLGHDPSLAAIMPRDSIFLCGHIHKLFKTIVSNKNVKVINVGIDVNNFTPISEEDIKLLLLKELL